MNITLKKDINAILKSYELTVMDATTDAVRSVAKEASKRLRADSPKRSGGGGYAKGWSYKMDVKRLTVEAVVYGRGRTGSISHVLENGHANRGGGRTRPVTHIAPVEQWVNEETQRKIQQRISMK